MSKLVKVEPVGGLRYSMEEFVAKELKKIKTMRTKKDFDYVMVVDGEERSGKSVLAQQFAKLVDEDFDLENIAMKPEEFEDCVVNSKQGGVVQYDEAYSGLASSLYADEVSNNLISLMTEMGQRNLFVIIVLLSIFLLRSYVAMFRTRSLFHILTLEDFKRGYYYYYNKRKKDLLYLFGRRTFDYHVKIKGKPYIPSGSGYFQDYYTVDEEEYRKKKALAMKLNTQRRGIYELEKRCGALIRYLMKAGVSMENIKLIFNAYGLNIEQKEIFKYYSRLRNVVPNPEDIKKIDNEILKEAERRLIKILNKTKFKDKKVYDILTKSKEFTSVFGEKPSKKGVISTVYNFFKSYNIVNNLKLMNMEKKVAGGSGVVREEGADKISPEDYKKAEEEYKEIPRKSYLVNIFLQNHVRTRKIYGLKILLITLKYYLENKDNIVFNKPLIFYNVAKEVFDREGCKFNKLKIFHLINAQIKNIFKDKDYKPEISHALGELGVYISSDGNEDRTIINKLEITYKNQFPKKIKGLKMDLFNRLCKEYLFTEKGFSLAWQEKPKEKTKEDGID